MIATMNIQDSCSFCDIRPETSHVIRRSDACTSLVSTPWFRYGQCLVIPNRHIEVVSDLEPAESAEIMKELGRLSAVLDGGFGIGIVQKHQPLQAENGIKMRHLHFHVFPRIEADELFPTPQPNSFEAFYYPSNKEIQSVIKLAR